MSSFGSACPQRCARVCFAGLVWLLMLAAAFLEMSTEFSQAQAQKPPANQAKPAMKPTEEQEEGLIPPEVQVQEADYASAREVFHTKLVRRGPSPQKDPLPKAPENVTVVEIPSGSLRIKAWMNAPKDQTAKQPAILFLHGGMGFGEDDWVMTWALREAGYVVMVPMLRGENGQAGDFTLFYDEVEDVLAAGDFLSKLPYVDAKRVYVAGHSIGGTLALLAAEASGRFKAAASFSASPDQVIYCREGLRKEHIPFDSSDPRELQMRSPMAYAGSLKSPTRLYYGTREPHFHLSSQRLVEVTRAKHLDVEAKRVLGGHDSAVAEAMKYCIDFFRAQ